MLTGATGVMGYASLCEMTKNPEEFNLRLLVRDSSKNRKKLARFAKKDNVEIIWGDLKNAEDVERAVGDADVVLHIGGMVSPKADWYPELTLKVNIEGTRNVVEAVKKAEQKKDVALVYIGSVSECSHRNPPYHWGRTGDPVIPGFYDNYSLSKIKAERLVAESSLRRWVVLRQSGILYADLLRKTDDPIMFHVPLRGVLEWSTLEDSARLMAGVSREGIDEAFWKNFYNIGSGPQYRLTNYEFETKLLKATKCPPPEKVFEPSWFATQNFHGQWYLDGDELERFVPFRANIDVDEYFRHLAEKAPWWMIFSPLAPAFVIRKMMRKVAHTPELGTLYWLENSGYEEKINAFFGSREAQGKIGGWKDVDLSRPDTEPIKLNHGYDESKPVESLDIEDMRGAARFRGGECLSETMKPGDLDTPLEWKCCRGHKFRLSPRSVLKGGHWCEECLPDPWRFDEEIPQNPFLAQIFK